MGVILTVAALVAVASVAAWLFTHSRVRRTSTTDLEHFVFRIPTEYFDFIGSRRPSAARFRELVESRALVSLYREWPALEKDFLAGERDAGHRGRPLMMDYLLDYRACVRELMRRSGQSVNS
jgi:hypothetical protein